MRRNDSIRSLQPFLVKRENLNDVLGGQFLLELHGQLDGFQREMELLRFGIEPSAVYFNPTERCNFNCSYCYLPEKMRREGKTMSARQLCDALVL